MMLEMQLFCHLCQTLPGQLMLFFSSTADATDQNHPFLPRLWPVLPKSAISPLGVRMEG